MFIDVLFASVAIIAAVLLSVESRPSVDLHHRQKWPPSVEYEPNMASTYAGPHSGVGAQMAWTDNSNNGQESTNIVERRPDELISVRLEFTKPLAATNTAEFTVFSGAGGMVVTWSMSGKKSSIFKAMDTVMHMDKRVGGDLERGLAKLKHALETDSN